MMITGSLLGFSSQSINGWKLFCASLASIGKNYQTDTLQQHLLGPMFVHSIKPSPRAINLVDKRLQFKSKWDQNHQNH